MIINQTYDFVIVGSGFSGSITAMALAQSGFTVCLVEKKSHPRFAVGESSTPIADMVLRDFAGKYDLPFLKNISRFGEWQRHYPDIGCGLKRGFSYFYHKKGEAFQSTENHSRELLVAASENDHNSDTHWFRSDVDYFLVMQAEKIGVEYLDRTEITSVKRNEEENEWSIVLRRSDKILEMKCRWILDATGSPQFSRDMFGVMPEAVNFETNTIALFSHFRETGCWLEYLHNRDSFTDDYPFNPDHSALHHILDEGWIWMLRFNHNLLSAGLVIDQNTNSHIKAKSPRELWEKISGRYPSVAQLFEGSCPADKPGKWIKSARLQRKLSQMYGNGWVALPHTAGFIDPLHSTGIAHALTGIENILSVFTSEKKENEMLKHLQQVEDRFFAELHFIDLLTAVCYRARFNFRLFTACVMLYFTASIQYEQRRIRGDDPGYFLGAGCPRLQELVKEIYDRVSCVDPEQSTRGKIDNVIEDIRVKIDPFNNAGLMNLQARNMYRHTAINL